MPRVSKDMKVIIAEAAKKRVTEKNVKRLTVKDIVGDCGITRQDSASGIFAYERSVILHSVFFVHTRYAF